MSKAAPYDVLFLDESQSKPDALPTPRDIDGSETLLHESMGSSLVRVQQGYVIKFGVSVHPIEAHNMLYVAKSTTVPVPKVYAIYQCQEQCQEEQCTITYIVMEYVPGKTLLDVWDSLDQARKTSIAQTLRAYFEQLRQLPHPGYYGNIAGGPPHDDIITVGATSPHAAKTSFATEDELINYVIRVYSLETGERMAPKVRYYRHVLPTELRGDGDPVFTHNDFQRKNVMVKPDGELVVIDWEYASWLPTYWEYASATLASGGWRDDWHDYVRIALREYPTQALWLSTMKLEMWC
ncbi:protein kinase-like domain-containing protein [Xylariomycetidae sp. FL2044]|nr:protein kinase-like domain-containing protein [Xylariomycetidae sp. FL2044]